MSPTPRPLVIKTTSGTDRPEATNQAFTVAAAAVAAGAEVSLWLTGESAWFALPGRAADLVLEHATPLGELLDLVLEGGRVTVCTQCAARRGIGPEHVLPGVRIAGAAVFVEESLAERAQALVY
jgi:predicted peroxiredoxin